MKELNVVQMANVIGGGGDDVADCIADAYTNHGWISVVIWVGTLYNAGLGIGIALGCIGIDAAT